MFGWLGRMRCRSSPWAYQFSSFHPTAGTRRSCPCRSGRLQKEPKGEFSGVVEERLGQLINHGFSYLFRFYLSCTSSGWFGSARTSPRPSSTSTFSTGCWISHRIRSKHPLCSGRSLFGIERQLISVSGVFCVSLGAWILSYRSRLEELLATFIDFFSKSSNWAFILMKLVLTSISQDDPERSARESHDW